MDGIEDGITGGAAGLVCRVASRDRAARGRAPQRSGVRRSRARYAGSATESGIVGTNARATAAHVTGEAGEPACAVDATRGAIGRCDASIATGAAVREIGRRPRLAPVDGARVTVGEPRGARNAAGAGRARRSRVRAARTDAATRSAVIRIVRGRDLASVRPQAIAVGEPGETRARARPACAPRHRIRTRAAGIAARPAVVHVGARVRARGSAERRRSARAPGRTTVPGGR